MNLSFLLQVRNVNVSVFYVNGNEIPPCPATRSVVVAEGVSVGVLWEKEISVVSCYLSAQQGPPWGLSVTQANKLPPHTKPARLD